MGKIIARVRRRQTRAWHVRLLLAKTPGSFAWFLQKGMNERFVPAVPGRRSAWRNTLRSR